MRHSRITLTVEQLEDRSMLSVALGQLPNTSNGIYTFADQLPNTLSDALARFVADNYAGTEKMTLADTQRFRTFNPNWVELHYRLATASGPVPYITNDQWGSDWASVTTHEDWFLHAPNGQRLYSSGSNWYQNDISNPAWQQYWLSSVIADMRAEGSLGVFADSFDAGVGSFWYDQYDPRFSGTNAANPAAWPNGVSWTMQLTNLITTMEAGLKATPEHFLYLPNMGAMVTGWENIDYSQVDGGMLEDFGDWGGGSYQHGSASDWSLSMKRALPLASAGKFLIMQPYLADTPDSAVGQLQRGFLLGTYLLLKGDQTFLNIMPQGGGVQASYFPEYGIDLGPALTPLPTNVSSYLWNGVYRRDFQKGMVLVNPGPSTVTINLDSAYQQVTGSGGGVLSDASLDAQGRYIGGSLSYTPVTQATLAPGSAAILMSSTATTTSPAPVQNLTATAGVGQVTLSWTPPAPGTFSGVRLVRNTHPPSSPTDGVVVYEGTSSTFTDTGLAGGPTYSYRAFSFVDSSGVRQYSAADVSPVASATPQEVTVPPTPTVPEMFDPLPPPPVSLPVTVQHQKRHHKVTPPKHQPVRKHKTTGNSHTG